MANKGRGVFLVNSDWSSGHLVFFEKSVGRTATGDIFEIGTDAVTVGGTSNDINFAWVGTTTGTFTLDAAAHTLALTGMATSTDGAVTITDATATSSTTTGALIVTGGIATAADITCGDDLFMSNGGVINFNAGEVTMTNGTSTLDVASTWTAGLGDELLSATITTTATLGSYANALFGKIDCSTTGKSVGVLAAVGAEVDVATAGTQGGYWCYQGDMNFPTGATITPWGSSAGFFYLSAWGAGKADFDSDGRLFSINGLTGAANKMLSLDKQTLAVDFDNGTTRYLLMSQAGNYPYFNMSTLGNTDDRFASFKGTQATPNMADGYGLFEIELTVSGTATGQINATSTWINLGTAAVVPGYITLHTDGIWDGTATLTNAYVSMQKYTCQLASNPAWLSLFELNFQSDANNVIDSIFNVNDPVKALGYTAGSAAAATEPVGYIPLFSQAGPAGGAQKCIWIYNHP